MYTKIVHSKSKTFLAFCFLFMAGAGIFSFANTRNYFLYFYISLFLLVFLSIIFWSKAHTRFALLCLLCFALGVLRFIITIPEIKPTHARYYNGQKVTLVGRVSEEPDIRISEARYIVAALVILNGGSRRSEVSLNLDHERDSSVAVPLLQNDRDLNGRILIKTRLYPEYHYGDILQIDCKLQEPTAKEDSTFRYDKYLARYGVWSVCNNGKVAIVSSPGVYPDEGGSWKPVSIVMKKILSLKSYVAEEINQLWSEPEASFMAGLLYGSRSGLPKELAENFSKTGVSHIVAVSGFNITIIATALLFIFISIGLYRQQAFWGVVATIIIFVVFTGASASVVRAGIMGILVLVAQQIGRLSRIGNALAFTAAAMVLVNPYVLVWDAGFQLSFLATMGLVYLSPLLHVVILNGAQRSEGSLPLFKGILRSAQNDKSNFLKGLYQTMLVTLSAIIATLPLILYQFGRLSIVAPLVNVLILWTIPWLMLVGFLALITSFIFFPLGQLIAWLGSLGLKYVILVVNFFGAQPWSSVESALPWWGMISAYLLMIYYVQRKSKNNELVVRL